MPSTILDPIAVTKDNVKDTIVKDNVYKVGRHLHRLVRCGVHRGRHQLSPVCPRVGACRRGASHPRAHAYPVGHARARHDRAAVPPPRARPEPPKD